MAQSLGGTPFEWEPDEMTLPETKKTVSSVSTYKGGAVFQWPALLEGEKVTLKWDLCSEAQYANLRANYLSMEEQEWVVTDQVGPFNVIVIGLTGNLSKVHNYDLAYRKEVVLTLELRNSSFQGI